MTRDLSHLHPSLLGFLTGGGVPTDSDYLDLIGRLLGLGELTVTIVGTPVAPMGQHGGANAPGAPGQVIHCVCVSVGDRLSLAISVPEATWQILCELLAVFKEGIPAATDATGESHTGSAPTVSLNGRPAEGPPAGHAAVSWPALPSAEYVYMTPGLTAALESFWQVGAILRRQGTDRFTFSEMVKELGDEVSITTLRNRFDMVEDYFGALPGGEGRRLLKRTKRWGSTFLRDGWLAWEEAGRFLGKPRTACR